MPRQQPAIDYAQGVLKKHPHADAYQWEDELWTIQVGSKQVSGVFADRDAAWRDAYERLMKGGKL